MPRCERIAVQEGEKGALRAAGRAGEAGEAAEETRDAPRESGEVAPKPNEEESEQDENEGAAAVGHGGLVRCGGEAGVLFDKGEDSCTLRAVDRRSAALLRVQAERG